MKKERPITFLGHTIDAARVICVDPVQFHPVASSIYRCGFLVRMDGGAVVIITEPDYSRRGHAGGPKSEDIQAEGDAERDKFVKLVWPKAKL